MVTLRNKVVVVTGASSGIGAATAIAFARKGSKVVIAARRKDRLEKLQRYIQRFNGNCLPVKADVANEKDVKSLFDKAEKEFGRVDILVNNAGRGLKAGLCDTSCDDWKSVLDTNLTGVFLCTREAVRRMLRQRVRGHIITVSSIAGFYGAPNYAAYCASKHGVTGFKRSVWLELLRKGIKVNTVHPARVNTEFFKDYAKKPSKGQMLSSMDVADHIVAIAAGSWVKRGYVRTRNTLKRGYYFFRYSLR